MVSFLKKGPMRWTSLVGEWLIRLLMQAGLIPGLGRFHTPPGT